MILVKSLGKSYVFNINNFVRMFISSVSLDLHFRLLDFTITIMASDPITSWEIDGETVETVSDLFFWAPKSLQIVIAAMKLKDAYSLEEKL